MHLSEEFLLWIFLHGEQFQYTAGKDLHQDHNPEEQCQ